MMHERGREHFFGQHEKPGVEEAGDDRRVLDEIRDLLDERGVILERYASTEPARVNLELARDAVAAIRVREDDEVLRQLGLVLVEAADLDRSSRAPARRQEPVPVRQRARLDVLDQRSAGAADCGQS